MPSPTSAFWSRISSAPSPSTRQARLQAAAAAEGFADFFRRRSDLAAWEIDHIGRHCGVSNRRAPAGAHKACIAVELPDAASVDRLHSELSAAGVPFYGPPESYVWNARCAYFTDPDDTLWEILRLARGRARRLSRHARLRWENRSMALTRRNLLASTAAAAALGGGIRLLAPTSASAAGKVGHPI